MKNLKFVDYLKIRGSIGSLGNENVGLYKYQNLINAGNGVESVFGNPNLTWETVQMFNIGADIRCSRIWILQSTTITSLQKT